MYEICIEFNNISSQRAKPFFVFTENIVHICVTFQLSGVKRTLLSEYSCVNISFSYFKASFTYTRVYSASTKIKTIGVQSYETQVNCLHSCLSLVLSSKFQFQ